MNFSDLPASGFTNTSPISYAWCKYHIDKIREKFGSSIELIEFTDAEIKEDLWAWNDFQDWCFENQKQNRLDSISDVTESDQFNQ